MNHLRHIVTICLAGMLLAGSVASAQDTLARAVGAGEDPSASSPSQAQPGPSAELIPVDEAKQKVARFYPEWLQGKAYETPHLFDGLIRAATTPSLGFIQLDDGRYQSFSTWAGDRLAELPPTRRKQFLRVFGERAAALYAQAFRVPRGHAPNRALLHQIAAGYPLTTQGRYATLLLAEGYEKDGLHALAAAWWERAYAMAPSAPGPLARAAICHHNAGDTAAARRALKLLTEEHAYESFPRKHFTGRTENVRWVEWVADALAQPPASGKSILGNLGTYVGGFAFMDAAQPCPMPQWRFPQPASAEKVSAKDLAALRIFLHQSQPADSAEMHLRFGHAVLQTGPAGDRNDTLLPPMLHPVAREDGLLVRTDFDVVCLGPDGQVMWRTHEIPMARSIRIRPGYAPPPAPAPADRGRYRLTVAGDVALFVGAFPPAHVPPYEDPDKIHDTSCLYAISLTGKTPGDVTWRVGGGKGRNDPLRDALYLTAPAVSDGRLYATAVVDGYFQLVCRDVRSGKLLWSRPFARVPDVTALGRDGRLSELLFGCVPSIRGGRVFVTSNAGVIACFDQDTGKGLWAVRYAGPDEQGRAVAPVASAGPSELPPAPAGTTNPLVVAGGNVLVLPTDGKQLLCLEAATGAPRWTLDRNNARYLLGVDERRVALGGPDLRIVSVEDGTVLHAFDAIDDLHGRPAVTTEHILACGAGRIHRARIAGGYAHDAFALESDHALLGNLLAWRGTLVTANTLGMCGYFHYDRTYHQLTEQIADTRSSEAEKKAHLLHQRAQLSFRAKRFDRALADLETARGVLPGPEASPFALVLDRERMRTHAALGNTAPTAKQRLLEFNRARQLARSQADQALMMLRQARAWEQQALDESKAGPKLAQLQMAAKIAQTLLETYPKARIPDEPIGPAALVGKVRPARPAYEVARGYLAGLINRQGRRVYERHDEQAKIALGLAEREYGFQEKADKQLQVARRFPNSLWRDDALLAGAETLYYRARVLSEDDEKLKMLERVIALLTAIQSDESADQRPSAMAALAYVYRMAGRPVAAKLMLDEMEKLPATTPVHFANINGTVSTVREKILDDRQL